MAHGNTIKRFLDAGEEPTRTLTPLEGYEKKDLVSIEEAVKSIDVSIYNLNAMVWTAKRNSRNPSDGLTSDESASIFLYTLEWPEGYDHFSTLLNQKLRNEERQCLTSWFSYLKLFLTALYKLPSTKTTVWRGIRGNVSHLYNEDFIWWGFSSCTTTIEVIKQFLGQSGVRTIFMVECIHGKVIKSHSSYQHENEVLLMPGTYLRVKGKSSLGKDLYMIHLQEENPPHLLRKPPFDVPSSNTSEISKSTTTKSSAASVPSHVKSLSHPHQSGPTETPNKIRLILLGRTGSGKSSFGNTILGVEIFQTGCSPESGTKSCAVGSRLFDRKQISIVDTPGFLDLSIFEEKMRTEIVKSYQMMAPGPHAFLLVFTIGRFTEKEAEVIKYLDRIFGSQAVHHTIIVFTRADLLQKTTIEQLINTSPPNSPLRQFLDQCGHRYITVNNYGTQSEKDATVKQLLQMISTLIENNNGQVYRSDVL